MSKRTITNKLNKNLNNNSKNSSSNKQYNLIINQNSTFNQDNRINIMLDTNFPYFPNYNYQQNETEPSNQIYPLYQEYPTIKEKKSQVQNDSKKQSNNSNNNSDKTKNSKVINLDKKKKTKKANIIKKKSSSSQLKNEQNDLLSCDQMSQISTNKIDYRYMKKCPINEMISTFKEEDNDIFNKKSDNQLFWFATYGKLMKKKHLLKIFNYYNNRFYESSNNNNNSYSNLKEKTLVIKDFEICFYENSNKPFIRYAKGGIIYTKLYLLTLKEINQIFNYINRIEYKINYDRLNYLQRKGNFEIINDNSNGIILPYCLIYSLGKYMNINIYSFSNNIDYSLFLNEESTDRRQKIPIPPKYTIHNGSNMSNNTNNIKKINLKLPSSKKIAKLIKIINFNYPDFSIEDIINYLIPDNKYLNSISKIIEIKNIFFFKKSNQNKIILSSIVRDTIKGISIQTPKSLISSFCPAESILENNSFKNSDLFQPITNRKYNLPIKDDYKFQTISTTEKDNNKNNPLVIYVCDNGQKISFIENQNLSPNQSQNQNIMPQSNQSKSQSRNQNIKKSEENNNNNNDNIKIKNELNDNFITDNTLESHKEFMKTDVNKKKKSNILRKNNCLTEKNLNNNQIKKNINKTNNIHKSGINNKRKSTDAKIKVNKYMNDLSNIFSSGNKKTIQLQRISTDMTQKTKNVKKNNNLSLGVKARIRKKTLTETNPNVISNININTETTLANNNNKKSKGKLNKSIESHCNYSAKYRLSKTSDIGQRRKQKSKNYNNNILLMSRFNMNKNENPFCNQ